MKFTSIESSIGIAAKENDISDLAPRQITTE